VAIPKRGTQGPSRFEGNCRLRLVDRKRSDWRYVLRSTYRLAMLPSDLRCEDGLIWPVAVRYLAGGAVAMPIESVPALASKQQQHGRLMGLPVPAWHCQWHLHV
jgi:hypothetical protein